MKIRTGHDNSIHPHITLQRTGQEEPEPQKYCGYSHCRGQCEFPALVLDYTRSDGTQMELKAHSSMVACGPVWQPLTREWHGGKIYLTLDKGMDIEILIKMMWW